MPLGPSRIYYLELLSTQKSAMAKSIVRGMRWSVVVLLGLLASGMTNEEILAAPLN